MLFWQKSRPIRCVFCARVFSCACASQACLGVLCVNVAAFLNCDRMFSTVTDNNLWECLKKVNGQRHRKSRCQHTGIAL